MKPLNLNRIKGALTTERVARVISYHASAGSTNQIAIELAQAGSPDGTLVIADDQSSGRGRLGRTWLSPPCSNLLLTLLLRPALAPGQAQRLTMVCSLAAADAIERQTGLRAMIKWPNDLLINGKKVAGILTELGFAGERLAYAALGMGLNVNMPVDALPDEIRATATSLAGELGRPVGREDLLCAFLGLFEERYQRLSSGKSPAEEWALRLETLGRRVWVSDLSGAQVTEGDAQGVDEDGALLVRQDDGELRRILAGDVTLRPRPPGQEG